MTARTNVIWNMLKVLGEDKIFTVQFIKKDFTERTMVCKLKGDDSQYTGTGMRYDPKRHGLLPVWDLAKDDHRMINLNTIQKLWIDNKEVDLS